MAKAKDKNARKPPPAGSRWPKKEGSDVEETIRAAEESSSSKPKKARKVKACVSCGGDLEADGTCKECGAVAKGGKTIAKRKENPKPDANPEPKPGADERERGAFDTIFVDD